MEYKTCTHIYDDGHTCGSAAAKDRDYCTYHLRCRARVLRMAQYRARQQRWRLQFPPLENMYSVQSALTQLGEALAADMIDLKSADRLLAVLRLASRNLLRSDKWPATPVHSDQPGPAIDLAAEYGLPQDIDLNTPPEVAFPPEPVSAPSSSHRGGLQLPDFGNCGDKNSYVSPRLHREPLFPEIPPPYVRDYQAEAEAAFFEATPEDMELNEILKEQGYKAFDRRAREHQRNSDRRKQRKHFRANYERYVAEAKLKNIQRAAEKLIADKLAAEKAAAQKDAAQISQPEVLQTKKPPARAVPDSAPATEKEAQSIA